MISLLFLEDFRRMDGSEKRSERLFTSNELSPERLGLKLLPTLPWLHPYGRIGMNDYLSDLPDRSRVGR
jgi:hypothetical protein